MHLTASMVLSLALLGPVAADPSATVPAKRSLDLSMPAAGSSPAQRAVAPAFPDGPGSPSRPSGESTPPPPTPAVLGSDAAKGPGSIGTPPLGGPHGGFLLDGPSRTPSLNTISPSGEPSPDFRLHRAVPHAVVPRSNDLDIPPRQPAPSLNTSPSAQPPLVPLNRVKPESSDNGEPPRQRRATPPEMIAEAIAPPQGTPLKGRPLSLLDALSRLSEPSQRLAVTRAYWRLAAAVAQFHFRQEESVRLDGLPPSLEDTTAVGNARSSSLAAMRAAELAVVAAQQDLAEKARLETAESLRFPTDRPHIGPYRTHFDELFASRTAPGRSRLIDRTLPVRRRAIDVRAAAVHAAEDALDAAVDAYRSRHADLATVLSCQSQLSRQREAMVASVRDYNLDIADYALTVAPPEISGQNLVGMLINPAAGTAQAAPVPRASMDRSADPSSGVQPATLLVPIPAAPQGPSAAQGRNEPTLAPPRETLSVPGAREPTLAPCRPSASRPGASEPGILPEAALPRAISPTPATGRPAETPQDAFPPRRTGTPTLAPPRDEARRPGEPASAASSTPERPVVRMAQKANEGGHADSSSPPAALYPALVAVTPAIRAKQLATTLNWDRALPQDGAQPVKLEDCLREHPGAGKREVVDAFWVSRQRAAVYQALAQQAEFLRELVPWAVDSRNRPLGAEAMLRLRAAKSAADADLLDAQIELLDSEYELTRRVGRPLEAAWLRAATAPHAGIYLLRLDVQPRALVESWALRRSATMIPALDQSLKEQGTAVVEADQARATATAGYQVGRQSIDQVLAAIGQQTDQTLAFLQVLTDYNQAIADYALLVVPPQLPAEKLVQTLVVAE
jgi:hypothetical protein